MSRKCCCLSIVSTLLLLASVQAQENTPKPETTPVPSVVAEEEKAPKSQTPSDIVEEVLVGQDAVTKTTKDTKAEPAEAKTETSLEVEQPAEDMPPKTTEKAAPTADAPKRETAKESVPYLAPRKELDTRSPFFQSISMSLRPGLKKKLGSFTGVRNKAFVLDTQLTYFFHRYFALNIPYILTRYEGGAVSHSVGGGPLLRYLDWGPFRGEVTAHVSYVRALDENHLGWGLGGDLTVGIKHWWLQPYFGPFFRYTHTYVRGSTLKDYSIGFGITLTEFTDLD